MKGPDPLLKGLVTTSSVGFPTELWKAVDEEVKAGGWKSRSAFLTALTLEMVNSLRAKRAEAELAALTARAKK